MRTLWIALLIAISAIGLTACGPAEPDEVTVSGTVTITPNAGPRGAYAHIGEGEPLRITDGAGDVIRLGELGTGTLGNDGWVFPFSVANVPGGHGVYGVSLGPLDSDPVMVDGEQVADGPVALTWEP